LNKFVGLTMRSLAGTRFPIKNLVIDSKFSPVQILVSLKILNGKWQLGRDERAGIFCDPVLNF